MKYISQNENVAISMYDSTQPEGTGNESGIQCIGKAKILNKENEIQKAIWWLFQVPSFKSKYNITDNNIKEQIEAKCRIYNENERRICKISLNKDEIYINSWNGKFDYRRKVQLKIDPIIHRSAL